tara:strand:- start:568 stop:1974 length:1407 start_codon:yes stop_codon:yes gene_type:complete
MAFIEEVEVQDGSDDEPIIEELSTSPPPPTKAAKPKKKRGKPKRDGVALTEDLIRRKAEHNEGMLSTLEEIALHQLDIDKIEVLNSCRHLMIVYLQNNLISKIEGLHRLKKLDYLNLALNNIMRIENLEGCEALRKLDMTCNFIDLDELHTVGKLKNNTAMRELYLTGNPCTAHWESGYRDFVIGTLPQLDQLDGKEVTKSERIKALQRLPALERELKPLAEMARDRREEQRARRAEKQRLKEEAGSDADEEDDGTDEWCPETRVSDAREIREANEEKEEKRREAQRKDYLFGDQPQRERRLFKDDGTPTQMNTAKWPFSIEEDSLNVIVDVALPRFLDSAAVRRRTRTHRTRTAAPPRCRGSTLSGSLPWPLLPSTARPAMRKAAHSFVLPREGLRHYCGATGHLRRGFEPAGPGRGGVVGLLARQLPVLGWPSHTTPLASWLCAQRHTSTSPCLVAAALRHTSISS